MRIRTKFISAILLACAAAGQSVANETVVLATASDSVATFSAAAGAPAVASVSSTGTGSKWDAAFAEFADADRLHPRPAGGVLFVGSSSIRLWNDLENQFDAVPVIKRGFGGSKLSDCVEHLNRLVVRYQPRTVLVYAGDNDLAAGTTPQEVARRFAAFVSGVHRALPDTRVAFISIKPSPSRKALLPGIREANGLIKAYADGQERVAFIDVYTPMVDADGQPRPELFRADALHLNSAGYALWKQAIAPHVR